MTLSPRSDRSAWLNRIGLANMRPIHLVAMAVVTAIACAAALTGARGNPILLSAMPLALSTGPLCLIDLRHRRLPNPWLAATAAAAVIVAITAAAINGTWWALGRAGLIGLLAAGIAVLLATRASAPLGLGDAKLIAVVGGVLGLRGTQAAFAGLCAGAVIAGIVAAVLVVCRKAELDTEIPCGPSVLAGAWLVLATTP